MILAASLAGVLLLCEAFSCLQHAGCKPCQPCAVLDAPSRVTSTLCSAACHPCRAASYGNLFARLDLGRGTRPFKSGGRGDRGAHTGRQTTFWNLGTPPRGDPPPRCEKHVLTWRWQARGQLDIACGQPARMAWRLQQEHAGRAPHARLVFAPLIGIAGRPRRRPRPHRRPAWRQPLRPSQRSRHPASLASSSQLAARGAGGCLEQAALGLAAAAAAAAALVGCPACSSSSSSSSRRVPCGAWRRRMTRPAWGCPPATLGRSSTSLAALMATQCAVTCSGWCSRLGSMPPRTCTEGKCRSGLLARHPPQPPASCTATFCTPCLHAHYFCIIRLHQYAYLRLHTHKCISAAHRLPQ